MDKVFTNAVQALASLYEKSSTVSGNERSIHARKHLHVVDAYFAANPPDFDRLLSFIEEILRGGGLPHVLRSYCKQLLGLAQDSKQMLLVWNLLKGRQMLPRDEFPKLARRIVASDRRIETYEQVLELVLEQF